MSNDINGTVVGIQGISVSINLPQDGYSLTYDGYANEWQPKPIKFSLRKERFTSDGYWTCPDGIYNVILIGSGGGGAGGGGGRAQFGASEYAAGGGGGGGGAPLITNNISVIPGITYSIIIGAGGIGGSGATSNTSNGNGGAPGGNTIFTDGTNTISFVGAGGGIGGYRGITPGYSMGGFENKNISILDFFPITRNNTGPGGGGWGGLAGTMTQEAGYPGNGNNANSDIIQALGGNAGVDVGTGCGGSGGGAGGSGPNGAGGSGGNGGNGSNGGTGQTGFDGNSAAANTGAGGGGAGGGGNSSGTSGNGGTGGNGGSGFIQILY